MMERDARIAIASFFAVLVVTALWWALALWPVPGDTPDWLTVARTVCFNAGPDGMPDASGWIMLIGQPLGMFAFLWVVWPEPLNRGLRHLSGRAGGQVLLASTGLLIAAGLTGAGVRVLSAAEARAPVQFPASSPAAEHPRLNWDPAALGLVDQRGWNVEVDDLRGRPALVTFAFAHCADICPLVVQNALRARNEVWGPDGASLVVVTLDPWRDTPARAPDIAARWHLEGASDHLLTGPVPDVEAVLDAWDIPRERDTRTGDVIHPALTYVLDVDGTIAFASTGNAETLAGLGMRLEASRNLPR